VPLLQYLKGLRFAAPFFKRQSPMDKVTFRYNKTGKQKQMSRAFGNALAVLGHGSIVDPKNPNPIVANHYRTREMVASPINRDMVSPDAAKLAAEHNIDISTIKGTGANGRVLKADVQALIPA
jgi:pyruvate/2-oxoglutarate dehydrogenase complex dihydrolipoamide acyltransferase (E2) component